MAKKKVSARVLRQACLAQGIFDLRLKTELAKEAEAGQFVALFPRDGSRLLPRPISICEADKKEGALRLVYRVAGQGTKEFSAYREGEEVPLLGILGNGFPLEEGRGKRALLMGGGIGIPPLVELARRLEAREIKLLLGYRDNGLFLREDVSPYGEVFVSTEDGSAGTRGNVMDILSAHGLKGDIIYACGPRPMLRAIKAYAAQKGMKAYLSLEERMACGVGACLGCVCRTKEKDAHSHVHNARVCADGPVFEAGEVEI